MDAVEEKHDAPVENPFEGVVDRAVVAQIAAVQRRT